MSTDLREELDALARTQTFSPDPSAWDRGRRARRRGRVVRGAAAIAAVGVIAGSALLVTRPGPVGPAEEPVRDGAIPSRIAQPTGPLLTDLAIGQASVAYVDDVGQPFLVSATTGETRPVELPDFPELRVSDTRKWFRGPWLALSPDGERLAYPAGSSVERVRGVTSVSSGWYRVVDLATGEMDLVDLVPGTGAPLAMSWTADGEIAIDVYGPITRPGQAAEVESWTIDPDAGSSGTSPLTGLVAPGQGISAPYPADDEPVRAVPFETSSGTDPERELPADLYPDGASVTPVGWADNSLLLARVGDDLALLTSPDRPEAEWTYRILVRDVPATSSLSVAVDLVPDLDGTSSQELTRDFGKASDSGSPSDLPNILAGVMAVLVGLVFIWTMNRRAGHGDH